jgi:hypothetical protein
MIAKARPVTIARVRSAYGVLPSLPRRCGRWVIGPPGDSVAITCNGPHGRWCYEGPMALEHPELPPTDLERVIEREHGDRFAVVVVRSVEHTAARTLVADVTLVFGVPWTLAARGSIQVLGHSGFELPLAVEPLAALRSQANLAHLRAALHTAARALRCGDAMARRFDEELRRDGRAIPAQLREVAALLRGAHCSNFDSSRM